MQYHLVQDLILSVHLSWIHWDHTIVDPTTTIYLLQDMTTCFSDVLKKIKLDKNEGKEYKWDSFHVYVCIILYSFALISSIYILIYCKEPYVKERERGGTYIILPCGGNEAKAKKFICIQYTSRYIGIIVKRFFFHKTTSIPFYFIIELMFTM